MKLEFIREASDTLMIYYKKVGLNSFLIIENLKNPIILYVNVISNNLLIIVRKI